MITVIEIGVTQMHLSPDDSVNLMMVGLFIAMVVGLFFIQAIMVGVIGIIFAIPALIYSAVIATVGSVIFFIGKYTKWLWIPLFKAIGFLWLTFVKIAAVTAIVAGIAWLVGYGALVSTVFQHVKGVF